jgi:hypothetical protein
MLEKLTIGLGAGIVGLLLMRFAGGYFINKGQKELEKKVSDNDKKQAHLEGEQAQEDKETKEKVDAIEKEKNTKLSGSSLADWFNNRK